MMSMNKIKQADPTKTRTGKQRLGPLTVTQLQALLVKEPRRKNKCKIQNRIRTLQIKLQSNSNETSVVASQAL